MNLIDKKLNERSRKGVGIHYDVQHITAEELKEEIVEKLQNKPKNWRVGQFVFNYIDTTYGVSRIVQFLDGVDCFYAEALGKNTDSFIERAAVRINQYIDRLNEFNRKEIEKNHEAFCDGIIRYKFFR